MRKEIILGGLGDYKPDSKFNKRQLHRGIKVEMEHTRNRRIAKEIAKDHLTEDKNYYRKLAIMEEMPYKEYKKLRQRKKKHSMANLPKKLGIPYFDLGFRVL